MCFFVPQKNTHVTTISKTWDMSFPIHDWTAYILGYTVYYYYHYHYHYRYYHHYHYWALLFCFFTFNSSTILLYFTRPKLPATPSAAAPLQWCAARAVPGFIQTGPLKARYPGTSSTPYRIKKGTETWGKGQLADFLSPLPLWGCHDSYPMLQLGIRRRNRHGQCCTMYGTFTNKKERTKPFVGPSRMKTSDSKVFTDPKMISQGTIQWCIWIFLQDYPLFHHKDTEIALKQLARP